MAILDFLTGRRNIERIRESGEQFARAAYDPTQVDPLIQEAQTAATTGLDVDSILEGLVSDIYRATPAPDTSVSQGQQMAMYMGMDTERTGQLGRAVTDVGIQDEMFRAEGRARLAEAQTSRRQLQAQRDAGIAESRMMAEAEAGRRRQQLLGGAINLASAAISGGGLRQFLSTFRGGEELVGADTAGAEDIISGTLGQLRNRTTFV